MIPILSGNVASALGGTYEVANSCRFGTDTYMDKDNSASSPTHADKYTISFWYKSFVLPKHTWIYKKKPCFTTKLLYMTYFSLGS